jgi:hypothetical protein
MSSNLILNDEIIEKIINKKTWKKKRMRLKFGKKKPNKNKIWEKNIANQKNYN